MAKRLNVLIADDSPTARQLMSHIVNSAPDMYVIGEAHNGEQAVRLTHKLKPDVILMDIVMPGLNGLDATREIMSKKPTPIVVVSSGLEDEADIAFKAVRRGALAVLKKPPAPNQPGFASHSSRIITTVRSMADVRVIHHWKKEEKREPAVNLPSHITSNQDPEIVAIASSTGGPAALNEIFRELPADYALPIVVVQHISPDFLPSLVNWLNIMTPLPITIARENQRPQPGHIYFAPGDAHLVLSKRRTFELDRRTASSYTPSGDMLLQSVARTYRSNAIGIVLTGMGTDGARGLRDMYDAGALTIAQDQATSVVYGMPQAAAAANATDTVLPIQGIARAITEFNRIKRKQQAVTQPNP